MGKVIDELRVNPSFLGQRRVAIDFTGDVSRTKQADKDGADINLIMKRYEKSGVLPVMNGEPIFDDFTSTADYLTAAQKIARFNSEFALLPAHVRSKFDNDPSKVIDFMANPANKKEAVELGLMDKSALEPVVPAPPPVAPAPVAPVG